MGFDIETVIQEREDFGIGGIKDLLVCVSDVFVAFVE